MNRQKHHLVDRDVAQQRCDWEDLAGLDAMWAVFSDPSRQFGNWRAEEFFSTAVEEIRELKRLIGAVGFPGNFDSALDFGCGLGRLTRALKPFCREVIGVDISERMVSQAKLLTPNCQFLHNPYSDLRIFPSGRFDLVYSFQVLQHQRSVKLITGYVSEFIRVLKPGGLAVFQVPYHISPWHRIQPARRLYQVLRLMGIPARTLYRNGLIPMCMTPASEQEITASVHDAGGRVLAVEFDRSCPRAKSKLYCGTK